VSELITITDPRSAGAEAYRGLRTNLAFARPDLVLRSLLVTSPAPDAEKSLTLANLAVVSAQSGKRVIVVDCDLRRPAQHTLFGLSNELGVSNVLAGEASLDDPPLQETSVEGLQVLTSGTMPPNPAELLGTNKMGELVAALAGRADLLLFDAPPVVAVTDAAVLAPALDGTLLVLAAGRSRRDHTERARETLDKVGATLIGVVLTGVEPDTTASGAYGSAG
jgi:capsular exopolysaccharide synthesis family protein